MCGSVYGMMSRGLTPIGLLVRMPVLKECVRSPRVLPAIVACLMIVISLMGSTGCQLAVPVCLSGVSMGAAYMYTSLAEQTFSYDLDKLSRAALTALTKMGMVVVRQSLEEGNRHIEAKATELSISIKLKPITSKSTKMRVNARKGILLDKATALEIIRQTSSEAARIARS